MLHFIRMVISIKSKFIHIWAEKVAIFVKSSVERIPLYGHKKTHPCLHMFILY